MNAYIEMHATILDWTVTGARAERDWTDSVNQPLGLELRVNERGVLDFFRGNEIPDIPECLTRRDFFRYVGS